MPTENPTHENGFAELIKDGTEAASSLAKSIEQQNQVMLTFCEKLISNTLVAMGSLSNMEVHVAKEADSKKFRDAVNEATNQAVKKSQSAQAKAEPAGDDKDGSSQKVVASNPNPSANEPNLEDTYQMSIGRVMENAVFAQQQLYVIAQATTTQTISTILSISPAVLATTVAEIIKREQK